MKTKTLLTLLLTTCMLPMQAFADGPLPTDPTVVAGDVTISNPTTTQLLLQQLGGAGIVDWGSFSIGAGFGVQINNGTGATLNRVTGGDLSSIMGSLSATGSVYLVNQNGIVIGASGVVDTGGTFVASALDIANGDFLAGGDDVFAGATGGYVINLGRISSLGGDVALLGRTVVNEGTITAPNGTVGLVAGREILMRDASVDDGMFSVRIGGADTSVTDSGAIRAAAAELRANGGNVYALAGNVDGTIAATGVARVKGRVFLTAGNGGIVKVTKAVKATAADGKGGQITVNGGTVQMDGVLDVSGTSGGQVWINAAVETVFNGGVLAFGDGVTGSGGFAEVSGRHLTFGGTVDTGGGTLLIDPEDIEISNTVGLLSGASILTTTSLQALLRTQNVIITTDAGAGSGTIVVSTQLEWGTRFSLSLLAQGDLWFLADVRSTSVIGGDLNLVAGWDGTTSGTAFAAAPFLTADLASTTVFGNSNGLGYTLAGATQNASGSLFIQSARVGALVGDTRAFANGATIGLGFGYSQLGFNVTNYSGGVGPSGDIVLRSTGAVHLFGGTGFGTAAQIGHIGMDFTDGSTKTIDASGNIRVEAAGSVDLRGGDSSSSDTFAMIGHGSLDIGTGLRAAGNRSGDITITAGLDISIDDGSFSGSAQAWIGHVTSSGTVSAANITATALSFDRDSSVSAGAGVIGLLDIAMLANNTSAGNVTFTTTDNSSGAGLTLTGDTSNFACGCGSITTTGDLVIQSAGDLVLDSAFTFSNLGGGDVALAAGADFFNNAAALAFGTMKGRWLVYSTRPDNDTGGIGTLAAATIRYGTVFNAADPFGVAIVGNGLVYAVQPVVAIDNATMTFGGSLTLPAVNLTVDGIIVDAAAFGLALDGSFVDTAKVSFSTTGFINAGVYATALDTNVSILPPTVTAIDGLTFALGQLTVDRAVVTGLITGLPTKIYDGTTIASLLAGNFVLSGFIGGDGAAVTALVGNYASANASTNAVTVNLNLADFAATSGTLLSNYDLPTSVSGNGVISQASLTVSIIGAPSKVYDGNTLAALTAGNYLLTGFAAGEGATVTQTVGAYGSANASGTNTVTATLAAGDFTGVGGTLLANYILPTTSVGNGVIYQVVISGSVIGAPAKVYDGGTAATLTAANFLLTGFITGENATVIQTVGTYASANASGSNTITAALAAGDIVAASGTVLANYILPTTVSGNGVISQAMISGSIIGPVTKVYDGSVVATLTAGNFDLTGFVAGDGATVSLTVGSYATSNVSATNSVSANLTVADFVAAGATNLGNYVLPVTLTGAGSIDPRSLVVAIVGVPTKPFDGTNQVTLTAANFLLTGFVAGEGASITQTNGQYGSPNSGPGNTVTVALTSADYVADAGTLLTNYILPTTATGQGLIDTPAPSQPLLPAPPGLAAFDTTPSGDPAGPALRLELISTETTQRIMDEINAGSAFCKALVNQEFVIDCLSDRLQSVADGLSAVGEYSEVRAALEDAAQKLHALALQNASTDLAATIARVAGQRSSRALTAIATAAMGAANAQAAAIIDGARLVLLRSSSGSERRSVAFTQVAQVVNSTKVLLRSS